jgi:hypothetical protein
MDGVDYDGESHIRAGWCAAWRRSFPSALSARILGDDRRPIDEDLVHLADVRSVDLFGCDNLTDAGVAHLRGAIDINIAHCDGVTGSSFAALRAIKDLCAMGAHNIEDVHVGHLGGVDRLDLSYCSLVSGAQFSALRCIRKLNLYYTPREDRPSLVTDASLALLGGTLETLVISGCERVTGASFARLTGLKHLDADRCPLLTDAAVAGLAGISSLSVWGAEDLTDAAFKPLRGVKRLYLNNNQLVTDAAIEGLTGVEELGIAYCRGIVGTAFLRLAGVKRLLMDECDDGAIAAARASDNNVVLFDKPGVAQRWLHDQISMSLCIWRD